MVHGEWFMARARRRGIARSPRFAPLDPSAINHPPFLDLLGDVIRDMDASSYKYLSAATMWTNIRTMSATDSGR